MLDHELAARRSYIDHADGSFPNIGLLRSSYMHLSRHTN